jgi:hypothetical protein
MTHDFLNPLELFRLTNTQVELLTPEYLRGQKRRFLSELEVDGKEYFIYHGQQYTRNDLERVVSEASTPVGLEGYLAAGRIRQLGAFLVTATTPWSGAIKAADMEQPALQPVLKEYFPAAYSAALRDALKQKDWEDVETLLSWQPHQFRLSTVVLYAPLDDYFEWLIPFILDIFKRFSLSSFNAIGQEFLVPKQEAERLVHGMRLFEELLPQQLMEHLPAYCKEHINQFVAESLTSLPELDRVSQLRMAREIAQRLRNVPYISTQNKDLLTTFLVRHKMSIIDHLDPSAMEASYIYVLRVLAIFGVFIAIITLCIILNPA